MARFFSNNFGDILKAAFAKKDNSNNNPAGLQNNEIPVIVGIDFGTSFTKAYCNIAGDNRPVEFNVGNETSYFLPSEVYYDKKGKILSLEQRTHTERICYFKYNMINDELKLPYEPVQEVPFDIVCSVFFLSRVIGMVIEHASQRLPGKKLKFHFNMGCPIANEDSKFKGTYDKALNAAYELNKQSKGEIENVDRVATLYKLNESKSNALLRTVPELYAEALWFINKSTTDEGIYTILDIGGGTVDYATIAIQRENGIKRTDIYSHGAKPLGIEILLKKFYPNECQGNRNECLEKLSRSDIKIPSHDKDNPLVDVQHVYGNAFEALFFQGVMDAKQIRPHLMKRLFDARPRQLIPYYSYGGGADVNWFHSIIDQHNGFIETAGIPKLHRNKVGTDLPSNRLIVAFQLAQPSLPDIGKFPWEFKKIPHAFVDLEIPDYLLIDD